MPQYMAVALGVDEGLDVGMVAAQRGHHRAAARAGGKQRGAHGIPDLHERHRPRGDGADAFCLRALGPQRGEVVTHAAALLHGERAFLEAVEDAVHGILDRAHDEAVEQRHAPAGAGPGLDAPAGQEFEVPERVVKTVLPARPIAFFHARERTRDAPPAVIHGLVVHRLTVTEAVLAVPDVTGNFGNERVGGHKVGDKSAV